MHDLAAFDGINPHGKLAVAALLCLVELTERSPKPVTLAQLAVALPQKPSVSTLELLFAKLRRAGLIDSVRGAGGGFQIPRPLAEISLAEVLRAVARTVKKDVPPAPLVWSHVAQHTLAFAAGITLHDVRRNHLPGLR